MKKVVILIDGQNLFYSLKGMNVIEKDIHWTKFFKALVDNNEELIRTYWFRPQKILDTYFTNTNIKYQVVKRHFNGYISNFPDDLDKIPPKIMDKINKKVEGIENWLRDEKTKFSNIEYNYDQLCLNYGNIEFIKTGIVKVNPFSKQYIGEKGVDISLAVKMISLSVNNKCDKIVLISGDYDYVEAIKFVKDNMTKIDIVRLHKGIPPKNRSVSRDLAVLADRVIDIYESDIKGKYSA